ncbi:MAG: twin-arginine translocation pathway signal protein [Novosphingobium sp. 16-62-11]|uniref:twin-arginine translocation pathway signal protein n=1 Tax=Novosphingobium sp. 17-62-19 TaxID=1970406 RepID=UPI000BCF7B78|nr:twin-arginine translocation pathway signal protein [Novosphingobium sp. 17-62-19]OYZ42374.1 MAG: twin-arginine translocation pathway signal protein [Novosphingobium sp. 16-62-11]OZA21640.1 MAG: twin-arginine translocation pathway signal protein [Novosphingobium sp. 17-62-19]HQS97066.1 twin-arginine translocation pathway signal protein [Novosphingobium sp.]
MGLRVTSAKLGLAVLALQAGPAFAQAAEAVVTAPVPPLVPADFAVPTLVEGPGFKLVPLGPDLVKIDFDAYMASIAHLQQTFTRSTDWPHAGLTDADAIKDMEGEQARFRARKSFAYGVLTSDGTRERGSVYVSPSPVAGYDAVVRLWVTKAEHDAGFDAALYAWVQAWVAKEWPFARVAYPGRAIAWGEWDALVKH